MKKQKKRVTCIALFDEKSLLKLSESIKHIEYELCKVPLLEKDREKMDSLPFHFTFCVWNENQKNVAIDIIN